jgi:topoisomerase-4 subunit A
MSTDEIIEAENDENETTGAAEEIVTDVESAAHSTYKVPKISDDAVKHHLSGMYQNWFLDYASYVILERAVPDIYDGLKPVQRRILHSMKRLDDGRYNKVANIVGHTMQFHPHGDASIGDALVQLGQKDLLIDCQGNWGNILTGDGAAAPRYIEARLSKFALETVFNPKTTEWRSSYDGRNKEPVTLPVKFPLLLAQGVEGIAVGLNSKILPHNFNELCDACIAYLRDEEFVLFPDFQTGGSIDVAKYNDGERGGAVKVRAKIGKLDNKTLVITEIPFGSNTSKLIESIIRASDKGKIKIRKVDDNTSANVEILVHLQPGISSDKTIDALYAFTDCELSISPNCCVIHDNKPRFLGVSEMLRISCDHTKELLKAELEIQKAELLEQLFFTSLEKIFIENRIYKDKGFEDSNSQDAVIEHIDKRLEPFKKDFIREITREDFLKLLEIKMMRITKFDTDKANDTLISIQKKIDEIDHYLAHLVQYTITWYEGLKSKYGKDLPRRTEIRNFETIVAAKVVEANEKLYVNYEEGFIGTSLRKDEFVCNCSDIDDIIIFFKDGKYKIVKVADKLFVGKNILHLDVFKKNDKRTVYNCVYRDGKTGPYYIKRFAVNGITRDKEYDITQGTVGSKVIYFTMNPNGEAEVIRVTLKPKPRLFKLNFEKDFSDIAIKGRQSMGNILTKNDIQKITLKQKGGSTLGGRKVWFDRDVLRLNYDNRGEFLGEFLSEDLILVVSAKGDYYTSNFDLNNHYEKDILVIEKFDSNKVWTVALWDAEQKFYYLKRFQFEPSQKVQNFLGENHESRLMLMTDVDFPRFEVIMGGNDAYREPLVIDGEEFISVKSFKAKGKRLTTFEVETINELDPVRLKEEPEENSDNTNGDEGSEENEESDEQISEVNLVVDENFSTTDDPENESVGFEEPVRIDEIETSIKTPKAKKIKVKHPVKVELDEPQPTEPIVIAEKPKKEKPTKTVQNDSVLRDDIVGGQRNDENDGQLTLF